MAYCQETALAPKISDTILVLSTQRQLENSMMNPLLLNRLSYGTGIAEVHANVSFQPKRQTNKPQAHHRVRLWLDAQATSTPNSADLQPVRKDIGQPPTHPRCNRCNPSPLSFTHSTLPAIARFIYSSTRRQQTNHLLPSPSPSIVSQYPDRIRKSRNGP